MSNSFTFYFSCLFHLLYNISKQTLLIEENYLTKILAGFAFCNSRPSDEKNFYELLLLKIITIITTNY